MHRRDRRRGLPQWRTEICAHRCRVGLGGKKCIS
jgi:hypothetical protein